MHCHSRIFQNDEYISNYMKEIHKFPILEEGEDFELARNWIKNKDKKSLERLINGHLRLVLKIAKGYSGYGLPIKDLISEGSVGIMQALNHFDPDMGYKFSTYSTWWIKAKIQEYIFNSWSLVKFASSKVYRKLFFNLKKLKNALGIDRISHENVNEISEKLSTDDLKVKDHEVFDADNRLSFGSDLYLSNYVGKEENETTWESLLVDNNATAEEIVLAKQETAYRKQLFNRALNILPEREKNIIIWMRLTEPPLTLSKIGEKLKLSRERVRQLEQRAFLKIKEYIKKHADVMKNEEN